MLKTTFVFLLTIMSLLLFNDTVYGRSIKKRKIKKQFKHSQIIKDHFTGFALYDLDDKKMIYELNSDKYFIPASNTKLFTFYTCLKILGDSIPALRYELRHDSLVFWGSGELWATMCPGGDGPLRACAGSNNKIFAFRLGIPGDGH